MFSTKLSRLAQRASARAPAPPAFVLAAPPKSSTARQRPAHQRRPSSSKASCPPDTNSSSSSKPAPEAKVAPEGDETATQPAPAPRKAKKVGRSFGRQQQQQGVGVERIGGKGRNSIVLEDRYAALPRVPDVQHMSKNDIDLASFFSLHRPLSLTSTIPPPTTPEAFSSLFTLNPTPADAWANGNSAERRPEDVIYTLHTAIEGLENPSLDAETDELRWEIIHESHTQQQNPNAETTRHLDGAPRMKSLEDLVAQFRPFRPPPPPQAFVSEHQRRLEKKASSTATVKLARGRKPQQKRYQTTIEVLEVTDPRDGTKSYSASSSPIIQLPDVEVEGQEQQQQQQQQMRGLERPRGSYLARVRRRQRMSLQQQQQLLQPRRLPGAEMERMGVRRRERFPMPSMRLISVKRQRKLKMKKHKYKKLMKRTRNLRRRLDRT